MEFLKPLEFPECDSNKGAFYYANGANFGPQIRLRAGDRRPSQVIRGSDSQQHHLQGGEDLEVAVNHQWPFNQLRLCNEVSMKPQKLVL